MLAICLVCDSIATAYLGCYGSEWVDTSSLDRLAMDGFAFDHCFVPIDLEPGGWRGRTLDQCAPTWTSRGAKIAPLADAASTSASVARGALTSGGRRDGDDLSNQLAAAADWIIEHHGEIGVAWINLRMEGSSWKPSREFLARHLEDREPLDPTGSLQGLRGDVVGEDRIDDLRDTYAARVEALDYRIGEFLDRLREAEIYDDSLVVFTADQGWPLGEHDEIGHCVPWLHEERDHVPLIVKAPGCRSSARSPALVTTADLRPTIESFLGIESDGQTSRCGVNLLRLARGEAVATREYIVEGIAKAEFAIRTQQWKLILPMIVCDPPRPRMLFEKPDDRWEFNDLAALRLDVADHLELQLRRYLDAIEFGTQSLMPPLRMDILAPTKG